MSRPSQPPSPKVSVLLPVYNAAATLPAAIESILAQDFADFELLAIDDGSRDDSARIAEGYAARDARVRAIRNPRNLGLPATLNAGLELAQADLVARMDADDISLPRRLSLQYPALRDDGETAVLGAAMTYLGTDPSRDIVVTVPTDPDEIARVLPESNPMLHPTVMMRRDAIRALGGYRVEFRNAEDYDLWLRVSRRHRLRNLPDIVLRYRLSPSGQTVSKIWEQSLYIQLAKVSHERPDVPLADLMTEAERRRAEIDHRAHETQAIKSIARTLRVLGHYRDALTVLKAGRSTIGTRIYLRSAAKVWAARLFRR